MYSVHNANAQESFDVATVSQSSLSISARREIKSVVLYRKNQPILKHKIRSFSNGKKSHLYLLIKTVLWTGKLKSLHQFSNSTHDA